MSDRGIFLHFANRELNKTFSSGLKSSDHQKFIRLAATMTSGYLCAPFSQIHEQYDNFRDIQKLITSLCASGKLILYNSARDVYDFTCKRGMLYGSVRDKYPFYFNRKSLVHEADYTRLASLTPTDEIKRFLVEAASGRISSNIVNHDDVARIKRQTDFIKRTLDAGGIAATYSVYEEHPIEPKPDEVIFLGELSSRIYIKHHCQETDSVVITGVYNDPMIEDFELFPVFDVNIQYELLDALGVTSLVDDHSDVLALNALVGDKEFHQFSSLRECFLRALNDAISKEHSCKNPPRQSILPVIKMLGARVEKIRNPTEAGNIGALAAALHRIITIANERQPNFREAFEGMRSAAGINLQPVILHVATDLEEEVAREVLPASGWRYVETLSSGKVSYNRYTSAFRHDILLVRSTAGSGVSHGSLYTIEQMLAHTVACKVLSSGICFGADEAKQNLADVIVADRVAHYEAARLNPDNTEEYRGEKTPCDLEVISRARSLRVNERKFTVHVGHVLSGEKLIDNETERKKLQQFESKAIGGDMEAAGLAVVCNHHGIGFSMIKGIADFATAKGKGKQREAAENAIKFTLEMISMGFCKT